MLTEVDIERIMAPQRLLEEALNALTCELDTIDLLDDDEIYDMLDFEISVSETNGLM